MTQPFDPAYPEFSVDDFLARFPEFRNAGPLISIAIANAARRVSSAYYLDSTTDAVQLLAADYLARTPYGRSQRLVADDDTTVYRQMFELIKTERVPRMIVI